MWNILANFFSKLLFHVKRTAHKKVQLWINFMISTIL